MVNNIFPFWLMIMMKRADIEARREQPTRQAKVTLLSETVSLNALPYCWVLCGDAGAEFCLVPELRSGSRKSYRWNNSHTGESCFACGLGSLYIRYNIVGDC